MNFNPREHHRRSVRLKGYDYALPGAYFITICTLLHHCLFGEIVDGAMFLNEMGTVVAEEWVRSPHIRPALQMDERTVMPNHIHGIVIITALDPVHEGAQSHAPEVPKSEVGASAATDRAPQVCNTKPGARSPAILQRKPRSLSSFVGGFKSAVTTRVNMIRGTPRKPVWQVNYHEHIIRSEESLRQIRKYIRANPWM